MLRTPTPQRTARRGYTLIELLVVIAIIGVLVSLVVAAVQKTRGKADEVKMRGDMTSLETALGQFKSKFGRNVPGTGGGPNGTFRLASSYVDPATGNFIAPFTAASPEIVALKSIWPRMDLADNGLRRAAAAFVPPVTAGGVSPNLATAGVLATNPALLDPNQCLAFFLSGGSYTEYLGFATNPVLPFTSPATAPGSQRVGPFFEGFKPDRMQSPNEWLSERVLQINALPAPPSPALVATTQVYRWEGAGPTADTITATSGNSVSNEPWFLDPWKTPYLFLTTVGGGGSGGDFPAGPILIGPWGGKISGFNTSAAYTGNLGVSPYRETANRFANHTSYQIISGGPNGSAITNSNNRKWGFGPGGLAAFGGVNYTVSDAGGDDYGNFRPRIFAAE